MTQFNRLTSGAAALGFARKLTGLEYLYGGAYPGRTDCSGLCKGAWGQAGVDISRTTYGEYLEYPIARDEPYEVGDLIFIPGADPIGAEPGHVMMYVAPGQVFQAPETGMRIGQYAYDTSQFEFRTRPSLAYPVIHEGRKTKHPSAEQIAARQLTPLHDGEQARLALTNGWALFHWDGYEFVRSIGRQKWHTVEYANVHFATPRVGL